MLCCTSWFEKVRDACRPLHALRNCPWTVHCTCCVHLVRALFGIVWRATDSEDERRGAENSWRAAGQMRIPRLHSWRRYRAQGVQKNQVHDPVYARVFQTSPLASFVKLHTHRQGSSYSILFNALLHTSAAIINRFASECFYSRGAIRSWGNKIVDKGASYKGKSRERNG